MKRLWPCVWAILLVTLIRGVLAAEPADKPRGTVVFASQTPRGWDVYVRDIKTKKTDRLTNHAALDFNAAVAPDGKRIAFVSERDGNMEIYSRNPSDGAELRRLTDNHALDDHPSWSPDGKQIVFTSTRQPSGKPGLSWNALYVMNADGSGLKRLSPAGVADLSPAWSPAGDRIAFASSGQGVWAMKPDGSNRRIVSKDGGWPTFAGGSERVYFHKQAGRWGIWRAHLDGSVLQRLTPEDLDVCTPAGSAVKEKLAVAVLRKHGRQIELLDVTTGQLTPVTDEPGDHWNPSLSADGERVYYHRAVPVGKQKVARLETWGTPPDTELRMLRLVDGMFPALSPDHKRIAFIDGMFGKDRQSLAVMNSDGTGYKRVWSGKTDLFSLSWVRAIASAGPDDKKTSDEFLAFARGGFFRSPQAEIDIATLRPDGSDLKTLIPAEGNNGWLSFAPDGKRFVFRSGRDGAKNLYIANRDGAGIRRLTNGKWTDTMCHWSPTGEWIAFSSNQGGDFHLWLIKPDGTDLRRLLGGARHNHPHFSPDGRWLVFASSYAGTSAEAISLPRTDEPFGELFVIRCDGTGLMRLTHNGSSEGTPEWGPLSKR